MMHRFLYLVLLQFGLYVQCYLMHPNYSYDQSSKSSRNINPPVMERGPMQDWSLDEAQGFVRGLSEKRMERHVDAIFTNTYRKFLGQISARRYLQNMIGKRLGQDNSGAQYPSDGELNERTLRDTLASLLMNLIGNNYLISGGPPNPRTGALYEWSDFKCLAISNSPTEMNGVMMQKLEYHSIHSATFETLILGVNRGNPALGPSLLI